jgi:shikimate dehydrogenase
VTLPFKHRAYRLSARRTQRAEQAQAVNTLTFAGSEAAGDNTDGVGLVRDLTRNVGCRVSRQRVLLLGAGGAAYGVCGALLEEGPSALIIANRTREKAEALCAHFMPFRRHASLEAASYDALSGHAFEIVINATSAGLDDAMPPLPSGVFAAGALAYDMVYGKATPFLAYAERSGARTADGLGMLVEQAAESFYVWHGARPRTAPVIALLRSGEP